MADDAIDYLHQLNAAAPDKPFFLYYGRGGAHAPHQPTPEWMELECDGSWTRSRAVELKPTAYDTEPHRF